MRGHVTGEDAVYVSVDETSGIDCAVVRALSEATGRDQLELPPLYESLDPDALDAVLHSGTDVYVAFDHAGCRVTVDADGVTVTPR